jgi:hypothetical protein
VWKTSAPIRTASRSVSSADRHDHEFLEVDRVVGMGATIDDVHHRHRQQPGVGTADIAVERQAARLGSGAGCRERDAENGVGAELALVGGAIERDHGLVERDLALCIHAANVVAQRAVDRGHGLLDALAHVTATTIAQFNGLMGSGRGTRWHHRAAHGSIFEMHVDFHGGVAAAVEDFPSDNINNGGHDLVPCWVGPGI